MWSKILDVLLRNLLKYSPLIVLSLVMLFTANLAWTYYKEAAEVKSKYERLVGQTQDYKQIKSDLAALEVQYKTQKQLIAQEEKDWAKERNNLKGQISALASATFSIPQQGTEQDAPDVVADRYVEQEVHFHGHDGVKGPPFGYTKISIPDMKTIEANYSAEVDIKAAVTREKDGRYHILTKGMWVLTDPTSLGHSHPESKKEDWVGKPWPLDITGGEFWINPTAEDIKVSILKPKFFTAPHINFGAYVGADPLPTYGLHGDVSVFGYGLTKNDLDFKLLSIGANVGHEHFEVNVSPIKWRIGNIIPLVDDLYIGAAVGTGFPPTTTYSLTLDTTL